MERFDDANNALLNDRWFALSIGNSRLHWAEFIGTDLHHSWITPHLSADEAQQVINTQLTQNAALYIASVVPEQCQHWERYPSVHVITLEHVPLKGVYPTLGIDRALAVWGAIDTVKSPVLVIDAGTALTFTGTDGEQLVGGAILPGVGLQFQSLHEGTAALPDAGDSLTAQHRLPPRWARNTTDAIASGILYTLLAGLRDYITAWWQQFPDSPVLLRGGDRDRLHTHLTLYDPALATKVTIEPRLIFWGLRSVRAARVKG